MSSASPDQKSTVLPGFRDPGVDLFLKIGGSLLQKLDACQELAQTLERLARTHRLVLFPGGGPIDNYIESLDESLHFAPPIHHQLCARAQDQTGLIFGSFMENAGYFTRLVELGGLLAARRPAILLPAAMILDLDVFEQSWKITSDTMAAYFAHLVRADRFAILTDVDGVYDDVNRPEDGVLSELPASRLLGRGRTAVDECLPPFLLKHGLACQVLNGFDVEAVESWITGTARPGTAILPE